MSRRDVATIKQILDDVVHEMRAQSPTSMVDGGDFPTDMMAVELVARGVAPVAVRNCEGCCGIIGHREWAANVGGKLYHLDCENRRRGILA